MATLRASKNFYYYMIVSSSTPLVAYSNSATTTHISGGTTGSSILYVYKGTVPTFPELTNLGTRSADLLLSISLPSQPSSYSSSVTDNHLRLLLGSSIVNSPVAASASGTATWFCLANAVSTNPLDLSGRSALIGTVGVPGSGADLEIASTTITAGETYKSVGVTLLFPFAFTL